MTLQYARAMLRNLYCECKAEARKAGWDLGTDPTASFRKDNYTKYCMALEIAYRLIYNHRKTPRVKLHKHNI